MGWINLNRALLQGSRGVRGDRDGREDHAVKCRYRLHGGETLRTQKRAPAEDVKLNPSSLLPGRGRVGVLAVGMCGVFEDIS